MMEKKKFIKNIVAPVATSMALVMSPNAGATNLEEVPMEAPMTGEMYKITYKVKIGEHEIYRVLLDRHFNEKASIAKTGVKEDIFTWFKECDKNKSLEGCRSLLKENENFKEKEKNLTDNFWKLIDVMKKDIEDDYVDGDGGKDMREELNTMYDKVRGFIENTLGGVGSDVMQRIKNAKNEMLKKY